MATVKGKLGEQDVILENAASEATLERILEALGGRSSSGGVGGASSEQTKLKKSQKELTDASVLAARSIEKLDEEAEKTGKTLGESISDMAKKAGAATSVFKDFARPAAP